jgi:hypothetical protein
MRFALLVLACAVSASVPIPSELLNEWSQFKADDEFYNQMDAFLETSAQTGQAGGDFEFKCETTCQLVQKNAPSDASAHASHNLIQTEEGIKQNIEEAFHNTAQSFLETQAKTGQAGGDFEFKCETTCQLVQKNTASESAPATPTRANNAAHNALLQTEAGVGSGIQLEQKQTLSAQTATSAKAEQAKDCYRLCLNPSMNPGCDAAANVVSMLETGAMTEAELEKKNWSLGSGSGNCLNSCVHVCMAVHESVKA